MASVNKPVDRQQCYIAIICALPREADAVMLLFDQLWDSSYGRADGDANTYTTGCIGNYNVVLVVLPNMGTNAAATAAANLRSSYVSLKLAFLVGICGGIPRISGEDVFLGDVVLGKTVIQYDYGSQNPGGFEAKMAIEDSLARANKDIRGFLRKFETETHKEKLQMEAAKHLESLQTTVLGKRRRANYQYLGIGEDKLFPPSYIHIHPSGCNSCAQEPPTHCMSATKSPCAAIGCDESQLILRKPCRSDNIYIPGIFIGHISSGNAVMKSGADRDHIAAKYGIIAFEMEGAGAWDEVPCIIVKGICDYSDSHKNEKWQDFAAATAASVMRAMLERYDLSDKQQIPRNSEHTSKYSQETPRNSHNTSLYNQHISRDDQEIAGHDQDSSISNHRMPNFARQHTLMDNQNITTESQCAPFGESGQTTEKAVQNKRGVMQTIKDWMTPEPKDEDELELRNYTDCFKAKRGKLGFKHPDALQAACDVARVLEKQGKYRVAELWYYDVFKAREEGAGFGNPKTLEVAYHVARMLERRGKHILARQWYDRISAAQAKARTSNATSYL